MEADKTQKLLKEKLKEKGLKISMIWYQRIIRRLGLPQYTEHYSFCGICSW